MFLDGMPAWKKAQKPLFSRAASLKKMIDTETPVVLVDLRNVEAAEQAHIAGAVSVPADQLASFKEKFPKIKKAPIVLYGDTTEDGLAAFATVRGWGYKNTTVLQDGFSGWMSAEMPVGQGATVQEIAYVPKPKPGAVSIETFNVAASSTGGEAVILDVRTDVETAEGTITGALTIPTEEVVERLSELPMDKPILVHCSTGVRAEMAYLALKEKGYNAKFLDANIQVAASGDFTVTEKE